MTEHTTFPLRDVGLNAGQARHEELELVLEPYVQGGIEFVDEHRGAGKVPRKSGEARIEYPADVSPVPAKLDVTAMDGGWSFRLRFEADFSGPCSRCLEPASVHATVDRHEVHDPDAEGEGAEELQSDHVREPGPVLDVTDWARESVALQFPTQVLCRPDCRGLCPQCGINLNEHPDHEHEKPADSRWDALKDLKLDDAE